MKLKLKLKNELSVGRYLGPCVRYVGKSALV